MNSAREPTRVHLRLYVTGRTPAASEAIAAVEDLQRELGAGCVVELIDVLDDPDAALHDGIYATPTIMRLRPGPGPARRVFGRINLSGTLRADLQLDGDGELNLPASTLIAG